MKGECNIRECEVSLSFRNTSELHKKGRTLCKMQTQIQNAFAFMHSAIFFCHVNQQCCC